MISFKQASGQSTEHINFDGLEVPVHCELLVPIKNLKEKMKEAGFDLVICSGFRSFEQQAKIWNEKASGLRAVLNEAGEPLDIARLNCHELMFAILRWSALPGASRHHWGTDVDVVDGSVLKTGYRPLLTKEETESGGKFAELHVWLDTFLSSDDCDFSRPYIKEYELGVAREPWHLSYRPLAKQFSACMQKEFLIELIKNSDIALKETVLEHVDLIYTNYVQKYLTC